MKKRKASTSMNDSQKELSADFERADSLPHSPQDFQSVRTNFPSTSEEVATILAYLKKIDASNEALAKHLQDLEANRPRGVPSQSAPANIDTPLNLQSHFGAQASTGHGINGASASE